MNEFPQCNRIQQGYPCSCPTCMRAMLVDNIELSPRQQQMQGETSGSDGPRVYSRDIPAHFLAGGEGTAVDDYGAPIAPMGNRLSNDPSREDAEVMQLRDANGFSAINAGGREGSHNSSSVEFLGETHTPDEIPQQRRQGNPMTAAALSSSSFDQQAKVRPKRKSKYNDDPPQSIYGPPFVTREITAGMTEDEIHRRIEYNAAVAEARKTFMRHKNNMAAKKSRERKQALIDELTSETQRLGLRLRQMDAANRELVDTAARVHSIESDNTRLRQENEVLRGHVEDLTRRLDGLTVERQRDADRLNAMLSLSQSQSQPQPQTQALKPSELNADTDSGQQPQQQHHNPQQHQERKQDEQQKTPDTSNEMNTEIDQFLSRLNGGDNESFNWDSYR
ncbi:hypothetical protein HD806DRAFT_548488 [Xylariaceae sp. AK1471]|nr:hypothetical protein HD806DRAFT_548488 [Xylariaceae sp. AK1471]